MDVLILLLTVLNIMLGTAYFITKLAQLDRRHVRRNRDMDAKYGVRKTRWDP